MKFGKRLGAEAGRGWDGTFLDYKACKRAISKDVILEGISSSFTRSHSVDLSCNASKSRDLRGI